MEYRLARSYEEAGYKIIESSIYIDNGKMYADASIECYKCCGRGRINYYAHVDSGICYACGGTGYMTKSNCRIYTYAERQKNDAAYEARKQRELEKKKAGAAKKREDWLAKYNISDGNIYIVAGCNSYEIKDDLKAAGAKYYSGIGWFFGTDTLPIEQDNFPEGMFFYPTLVEEVFYWNEVGGGPYYNDHAVDNINKGIKKILEEKNKEKYGASEWVGEIGERLRNMKAKYISAKYFEGKWGGSFCYTFQADNNVFTWFSQSVIDTEIEPNDDIILTGTVKNHTEYNGILQTQLSRCIVKKGSV
jgi:hypothetical protein